MRNGHLLTLTRRAILTAVGLMAMVIAACALASRYVPITNHVVLATAAASPFLMLCGPISIAAYARAGRWFLAALTTGLTATAVAVQLPLYIASEAGSTSRRRPVRPRGQSHYGSSQQISAKGGQIPTIS
jgi:hypothetical protein